MKYLLLILLFNCLHAELQVKEMKLSNGLHLFLKPFDNGDSTISIQLTAAGGFISFPEAERSSARLAADIVWESGFGPHSAAQIDQLLYEASIEFSFHTKPFYRYINVESPPDELPRALAFVAAFMQEPHFDPATFEALIKSYQAESSKCTAPDCDNFEEAYFTLNGVPQAALRPLSMQELHRAKLDIAKKSFSTLFGNPSDFVCVIAGNFKTDKVKEQLNATLAKLKKLPKEVLKIEPLAQFPSVSTTKSIPIKSNENWARLTFPLQFPITEENFLLLDLTCQLIEIHLRELIFKSHKDNGALDVNFELPFYPSLDNAWMMVQFRAPHHLGTPTAKQLLTRLEKLQKEGFAQNSLDQAKDNMLKSDQFWQNEEQYWLSFITNAALFRWNLTDLYRQQEGLNSISLEKVNAFYKKFTLEPHTLLIGEM